MKSISQLNIAAIIAALTVPVIAFILIPKFLWTATTIATAIGFAVAVGYVFYVPSILRHKARNADALQMAGVGLLLAVSIVLMITTGAGFLLALVGYQKLGLALLVFGISAFIVMTLVMNAALKVVCEISVKWSQPSHHVDWQTQVAILASQATHQASLEKLHEMIEKLRYSASDVPGGSPQDTDIEQIFNLMAQQLQTAPATDLTNQFGQINGLLARRDAYLRSARSNANRQDWKNK